MRHARVLESIYRDRRISDAAFRVLVCLLGFADKQGFCYPSVGTIARDLARTRSTIRHHLNVLVERGCITREAIARPDGSRGANRYCVARLMHSAGDTAPADRHVAAAAGDQESQPTNRARQPSLLLPLNGGNRRTAGGRSDRKSPTRQRRAGLSLSVQTALAEMKEWAR